MNEFLGLYPAWLEPGIGAGWVIGFIATIHVLFSHASVGAALVFAWLARRAVTANQPQHIDFIRKYGAFLLIFSYVLGSVTGPGIWFAATIASPRGISALIHNFVWLWATEWVFFLIEVAGVYLLVYLAGRVPVKTYLRYCTIFALSSVGTLLIIVGILSFMLWPAQQTWYQTGGVLTAFFGESMFAQLSARFFFMLTITGVVGGFAAAKTADPAEKAYLARTLSGLGAVGAVLGAASLCWFVSTLSADASIVSATRMPESFEPMMWAALAVTLIYFAVTAWRPSVMNFPVTALATLVILVMGLAPGETAREIVRKPWVAGGFVYANQIVGRDVPALGVKSELPVLAEKGFLATHPFVPENLRKPQTKWERLEAGRIVSIAACSSCHSLTSTGVRPIAEYFPGKADAAGIKDWLSAGLYRGHIAYMPPLPVPEQERGVMSEFLAEIIALQKTDPQQAARIAVKGFPKEAVQGEQP